MAKEKRFSHKRALIFFIIAVAITILVFILAINLFRLFKEELVENAFDVFSWLLPLAAALVMWILFFTEINKVTATDEELEEWKNQILEKHPNFTNFAKQEDMKKLGNKFSFWLHTLRHSFAKITTAIVLPVALVGFVASAAIPFFGIFSDLDTGFSYGVYLSDCSSCVVVTAYNFKSDKTYQMGMCDKEAGYAYTWKQSGNYSISGSTITIPAGSFTIVSSTKLKDSTGGYWVKR